MSTSLGPVPKILDVTVVEREPYIAEWDMVDQAGDKIPLSAIGSFTYTLYAEDLATKLFGRDAVDILNANGGSYDEVTGHVTIDVPSSDQVIVNATGDDEVHYALVVMAYGSNFWNRLIKVKVKNIKPVA